MTDKDGRHYSLLSGTYEGLLTHVEGPMLGWLASLTGGTINPYLFRRIVRAAMVEAVKIDDELKARKELYRD